MRSTAKSCLLFAAIAVLLCPAGAQSLGEAARKARKSKPAPSPATRVYTNDNLPTNAPISVMSASETKNLGNSSSKAQSGTADSAAVGDDDSKKNFDEWRTKIADQKNKVALMQRELDVLQREHQIQVAVFYADAGMRLRDDRKWADQERQYKSDMESKQKNLDSANQRLEEIREEARKAGVPASVTE